jgi:hypothetical protein
MKRIATATAGLALFGLMAAGPATEAKADGGAIAIGVGAYLLVDALVGDRCHREEWPFNMVGKLADELHGRPGCYWHDGHRHYHHRHHHHHHHRKLR